jgi:hypothetical protein
MPKIEEKTPKLRKRLGAGGGEIGSWKRVGYSPHLRQAAPVLLVSFEFTEDFEPRHNASRSMGDRTEEPNHKQKE